MAARKPPFNVPKGLSPLNNLRLEQSFLLKFYELNKDDFFAVTTVIYFDLLSLPDKGALVDPEKGFDSFCDLMTQYMLAPASETVVSAKDEHGLNVNFFGEAIMKHAGNGDVTAQQLYASDGEDKHAPIVKLTSAFVRFVAIDCFNRALAWQENMAILKAQSRIKELQTGSQKLKFVPERRIL